MNVETLPSASLPDHLRTPARPGAPPRNAPSRPVADLGAWRACDLRELSGEAGAAVRVALARLQAYLGYPGTAARALVGA